MGMTKEGMIKDKTGGVSTAALAAHCDQDGVSQMANGKALQEDEGGTGGVSTAALAARCDQDGVSQMANGEALREDEDETGGAGGEAVKSGFSGSGEGDGAEVGGVE